MSLKAYVLPSESKGSMSITAIINTKNAEETLERTLQSVAFADEIVVADMGSTDQTKTIAKKFTTHIIRVSDATHVEPARNQAIAAATSEWILVVDADEVIPKSLANHLSQLTTQSTFEVAGYLLPRQNLFFGKWLEHSGWWPDYNVRFFKKNSVVWDDVIHSTPKVKKGELEKLPATQEYAIVHHNYTSVEQFIEKLNRYTTIEAVTRKKMSASPIAAFRQELLRRLFAEDGLADGAHGVAASFLQSFYELSVSLKQWQKKDFPTSVSRHTILSELEQFNKELRYWLCTERMQSSSGLTKYIWKFRRRLGV